MLGLCGSCANRDEYGYCQSEKIAEDGWQDEDKTADMLIYDSHEDGRFWVGEKFGCVHHVRLLDKVDLEESADSVVVIESERTKGLKCECGGYAEIVDTTDDEEDEHGCGRGHGCCLGAFICTLCGKRVLARFPAPETA
jgi:hypothetical protein